MIKLSEERARVAAGAKRRWQHLPPAMCWGDPVTPSCPRGICPLRRGRTHGEGARGALCPHQPPAHGMGMWELVFGDGSGTPAGNTRDPIGMASPRHRGGSGSALHQESRTEPRRGVTSAVPRAGDSTFPVPARRRFSTSRDPTAFPGRRATLFTHHT